MKRVFLGIAVAAVAAMGVVHTASADALDDIKKAGKIRIAIDLGVPPYGMTDDKMQPTGSDVATAKALAKDWGLEFELVPTTGATRIPSLQTGKADLVISTLSITPERAKVIDFSKGYAVLRTVIAAPKSVNVMCIGAQIVGPWLAKDLVAAYLSAKFSTEEELRRRVAKLADMDAGR